MGLYCWRLWSLSLYPHTNLRLHTVSEAHVHCLWRVNRAQCFWFLFYFTFSRSLSFLIRAINLDDDTIKSPLNLFARVFVIFVRRSFHDSSSKCSIFFLFFRSGTFKMVVCHFLFGFIRLRGVIHNGSVYTLWEVNALKCGSIYGWSCQINYVYTLLMSFIIVQITENIHKMWAGLFFLDLAQRQRKSFEIQFFFSKFLFSSIA